MKQYKQTGIAGKDEILFLPLGGTGEIGMNLNLYGHDGQWLMIDCGITFGDANMPGVEIVLPDISFVEDNRDRLVGLVLTHAHEDHLGAVHHLWERFGCPIYATAFTASILRRKLAEKNLENSVPLHTIELSGRFNVGVFALEFITLTHSIPEPNAIVIRTASGTILHTGDWKFDPDPLLGENADQSALTRLGDEGVLAMVCDSTNALLSGRSGSEGDVRKALRETVASLKGRVAVACFASNVARLESAALAGYENGRQVALVGRSLWRMQDAARENGYLVNLPPFLTDMQAAELPRDDVLYICTGSQGESRAALARIARGDHAYVKLEKGDHVVFSSREIPGNEQAIANVQEKLIRAGVNLITAIERPDIHTSGHPNRDELAEMYQFIKPRIALPVHGTMRHLVAHAELAKSYQVPYSLVPHNGMIVGLHASGPSVLDMVYAGKVALDGSQLIETGATSLRDRRQIAQQGIAVISLAIYEDGELADDPIVSVVGIDDPMEAYWDGLVDFVIDLVAQSDQTLMGDEKMLEAYLRARIRKNIFKISGKKPQIHIHILAV